MAVPAARSPRIAIVIPAYNHEAYVAEAIASVLGQDWPDLELHVLDDGSTDGTYAAAERALDRAGTRRCSLRRQENVGSAETINRLVAGCDSDLVGILNSDDRYLPGRLQALAALAEPGRDFLGFTGVAFDPGAMISPTDSFETWYRGKIAYALSLPTCGFALVTANLSISSSNFLFSRELFDRAGGFNTALPLTQDWEFLLKALRWTEPRLVARRLLYYRAHATNSFRRLVDIRIEQSRQALDGYLSWADDGATNPLAPTPVNWPRFFPVFAGSCAPAFSSEPVGTFLPQSLMAEHGSGGSVGAAQEGAALHGLVLAARQREANVRRPTRELLERAAAQWDGVRAAVPADG